MCCIHQLNPSLSAAIGKLDWLLFRRESVPRAPPFVRAAKDYYRIRYVTALVMVRLWWLACRRKEKFSAEEFRQDLIDVPYVVAATYFDGLLTTDDRMKRTFWMTQDFLDRFEALPVAYLA